MRPVIDFSSLLSVSNTEFDDSSKYLYTPPSGMYLWVREISVAADSTFLTNGRVQAFIQGSSITSQASSLQEVQPLNGFTIRFDPEDMIFIAPNENFEARFKVSTGTGKVQAILTGILITVEEYHKLMAKYGLEDK